MRIQPNNANHRQPQIQGLARNTMGESSFRRWESLWGSPRNCLKYNIYIYMYQIYIYIHREKKERERDLSVWGKYKRSEAILMRTPSRKTDHKQPCKLTVWQQTNPSNFQQICLELNPGDSFGDRSPISPKARHPASRMTRFSPSVPHGSSKCHRSPGCGGIQCFVVCYPCWIPVESLDLEAQCYLRGSLKQLIIVIVDHHPNSRWNIEKTSDTNKIISNSFTFET